MRLEIEQFPDREETVIEGTRYSNDLLRMLGQHATGRGPFLIEERRDGLVVLRSITRWPESSDSAKQNGLVREVVCEGCDGRGRSCAGCRGTGKRYVCRHGPILYGKRCLTCEREQSSANNGTSGHE